MNKDLLNELLANPKKLETISLESLEDLAIEFPYFMVIQKLINEKRRQIDQNGETTYVPFNSENGSSFKNNAVNNFEHEDENEDEDEDEDEEFTDLEIHDKELPFENIETENDEKNEQKAPIEATISLISEQEVARLQTLAGDSTYYFKDDLSLLSYINENILENIAMAKITSYPQIVNIIERDNSGVFSEIFNLQKHNAGLIFEEAKILFHNKYQKLLIEKLGFSTYINRNNLKQIIGIGEILEKKLNQAGIYTFIQLTNLNEQFTEILTALIDYFPGRIERDNWVTQAQKLTDLNTRTLLQKKANKTIKHLAEKLEAHKHIKFKAQAENKATDKTNKQSTKTFLDWLNDLEDKKDNLATRNNIEKPLLEKIEEAQPRLVKVNEDNLAEIHNFLGNDAKDFHNVKPVFEFLPGFSVKEIAAKSLEEDKDIVSTTLAKIYEQQQYFDKAINIYQKLILKFPEKSGFFADRIQILKEKV